MALFKYFSEERHALSFLERGEMLMRPLSWFRRIEDGQVRGDALDGVLVYAPEGGLELTMQDGRTVTIEGGRFHSSARHDEIFAFCASRTLSPELARRFDAPFCVEVDDADVIVRRLRARATPRSRLDYDSVLSGPVDYRRESREPGVDWALPERIALTKPAAFAWQDEHRIAIGTRGALDAENVAVSMRTGPDTVPATDPSPASIVLRIGPLREEAILHRLAADLRCRGHQRPPPR